MFTVTGNDDVVFTVGMSAELAATNDGIAVFKPAIATKEVDGEANVCVVVGAVSDMVASVAAASISLLLPF